MVVTRVPVLQVRPQVEHGRFPVKTVVGEEIEVRARVFGEGGSVVGAAVVVTGPDGEVHRRVRMRDLGDDHWSARIAGDTTGSWSFSIESWHDPVATWLRDAALKIEHGVDVEVTLAEGALLLDRLRRGDATVTDPDVAVEERLAWASTLLEGQEIRDHLDATDPHPFVVDRSRALVGSWYQLFPRSEGAVEEPDGSITPGTFATAARRLDAIADLGFDVVLLPPIHPIGSRGRKGRNDSLTALPGDPGSPWAVGDRTGGHDAVHPDLGTIDDLDAFVARADELGLEVALDLTLQCSPDHPWVREHPEWFATRPDGTFAFAEDPPEVHLDVYRLSFDEDPAGLFVEVRRVIEHWIDHGIRIFRAHDPHTTPLAFWEQLLLDLRRDHPDVLVVAGSVPTAAMRHALALVGFHHGDVELAEQEHPRDLADTLLDLGRRWSDHFRPAAWVTRPDLLPVHLQSGDPAMFRMRAGLSACLSPTWGFTAGFELLERDGLPGRAMHRNAETFEIKVRDWSDPRSIAPYLGRLNAVRRAHPALTDLRSLTPVSTDHHRVVAFTKQVGHDVVLVVVDARPWFEDTVRVTLDLEALGLLADVTWHDELEDLDVPLHAVPIGPDQPVRVLVPRPSDA